MLPFLNMRLYGRNNLNLNKHIEKMKNNQLTIENILEEDDIIQDLKLNTNSQFLSMLSNEAIRKLMDYATKMPEVDDQKIGHKYPFNATEILIADNSEIQSRIMNEIKYKESEFNEEQKEEKENEGEENKEKKEEKEPEAKKEEDKKEGESKEEGNKDKDKVEEKKLLGGFLQNINKAIHDIKEDDKKEKAEDTKEKKEEAEKKDESKPEEKKEEKPEEKKEEKPEEKKDEPKPEEKKDEAKPEEKKEEKPEEKPEEKKDESKPEEKKEEKPEEKKDEAKPEEKKDETKPEEKKDESKPEDKKDEAKPEEKKDESKPEEKKDEAKPEEKKDESKPEEKKDEAKPEDKKDETKPEENKDEAKPEDKKEEEKPEGENEEKKEDKEEEGGNPTEDNDEEKGQHKHKNTEEDDEKDNEDNEESENEEDTKTVSVYDNIDHLFEFLKASKETVSNHVLVGYFYKILNHLITSQSSTKIVQYIFDYPYKNKFDLLGAFVNNLNRKSMGSIINKLLLFSEESSQFDFEKSKAILIKKMLEELEKTDEKDKYECICDVFSSTLTNKSFYALLMSNNELVELLFSLLEKSTGNPKKLISIMNLLIKVNENVLKNFSTHCTKNLIPENPLEFMNMFNYESSYPMDEKQITDEEMNEINNKVLSSMLNTLKKNEFKFLEDLGEYTQDNAEFKTTYLRDQKKIGMKKLAQIEFLRTILDIFVNAYNAGVNQNEITELIDMMKNKNIFYNCHKLFFDFPHSNIYQIFYNQIVEIVLNGASPENLVEYFCKYTDEQKVERNLVKDLMDNFFNKMKFTFSEQNVSFDSNVSFDVTLLNKIVTSENEKVKKLFENDNDFKVFNEVLGDQINNIFNQKLLLADNLGTNMGDGDDEKPLPTFGKLSFMEIVDEDTDIYNLYKKGEDYKTKLNEKLEREKAEREKMEQEIVGEEEENKDEQIEDNEENEEGVEEAGVEKNEGEEEGEENNENNNENGNENDKKEDEANKKENENENEESNESMDKKSESTEESVEEKQYNDVNFWNAPIQPTDDIMSSILNDIE